MGTNPWRDVTIPMHPKMTVWPGDPPFAIVPMARMAAGDSCNTSRISLSTHTGTHMDAPLHFLPDGVALEQTDPALFFGDAQLVDLTGYEPIAPADLCEVDCRRVLIKTRNAQFGLDDAFHEDYVGLPADAAQVLVDKGVRLVGIDYLSIGPFHAGEETHRILLTAGVLVVEGLRLTGLPAGMYEFVALPLAVQEADGAPCRAFLRTKER